jgi:hypothetical protein
MKVTLETTLRKNVGPRMQVVHREIELGDSEPGFPDLQDFTLVAAGAFEAEQSDDHYYANPECSLRAPSDLSERGFLNEAEKACGRWMQRLRKTFGRGRLDRMLQTLSNNKRMLVASGVLYLRGRPAHPKRLNWRVSSQQAPR